jgi:hypothetical protein
LHWLVDQDPAYLAVDTDSTTLLERFTAVHFLFCHERGVLVEGSNWVRVCLHLSACEASQLAQLGNMQ